jgi:hypothetical protein
VQGSTTPILAGDGLPALRHLGLAHSDLQDEIAIAVSSAPLVARLRSLDLSLGTLGNEGVEALLEGVPLTHLEWLDLRSEYIGADTAQRIRKALEPHGGGGGPVRAGQVLIPRLARRAMCGYLWARQ